MHLLEGLGVDERFVPSVVLDTVVLDDADVEAITKHPAQPADISPGGVRIVAKLTSTGRPALRYPAATDVISDRPSCFVFER